MKAKTRTSVSSGRSSNGLWLRPVYVQRMRIAALWDAPMSVAHSLFSTTPGALHVGVQGSQCRGSPASGSVHDRLASSWIGSSGADLMLLAMLCRVRREGAEDTCKIMQRERRNETGEDDGQEWHAMDAAPGASLGKSARSDGRMVRASVDRLSVAEWNRSKTVALSFHHGLSWHAPVSSGEPSTTTSTLYVSRVLAAGAAVGTVHGYSGVWPC